MKPAISPVVIFRVPKFSHEMALTACWETLKADISFSSPEFYDTIKDLPADALAELPFKTYFTIWKYFNRARFRATPFGTFGAFGITSRNNPAEATPIVIDDQFQLHSFINWPQHNTLNFDYRTLITTDKARLFSNTSFYFAGNSIRYIASNNKAFELSEIENQEYVTAVLQHCLQPISLSQLFERLNVAEGDRQDVIDLVMDMIELQLILTEVDPNIIGEDYFTRIGITGIQERTPYLIAEVYTAGGGINNRLIKHIPDLIDLLRKIVPRQVSTSLQKFTDNYKRKFELREVPLMMALDPEIGVGYDELEQGGATDDFVKQFTHRNNQQITPGIKAAEDFIGSVINSGNNTLPVVFLDELNIETAVGTPPLPNTFSVIATAADELVVLDNIGGVTANALNGRFTLASEEMLKVSRDIAAFEAAANSGVLFFDVAYMAEANVDNINRRKSVYDLQLSILSFDTSATPLTLDDIMISVKGKDVVLRSKKLNKRLVPRMASAYNYGRSDLSLFRLLCDLQHQGLQSQLTFAIEKMFPGRNAYPRVQFRNLVVSPRMWRMESAQFAKVSPDKNGIQTIRQLLEEKQVTDYFKAGMADQTLCFNKADDTDMLAFITYGARQQDFFVEEVILPTAPIMVDDHGRPYMGQFILNLNHPERIYQETFDSGLETGEVQQIYPPGSEWLYFEIYCHPQRADLILQQLADGILTHFSTVVSKWFFIRFSQNGEHIRFRVQLADLTRYQEMVAFVATLLGDELSSGLVADISIKTYKRELARYGSKQIDQIEAHFWADSTYVLQLLAHPRDEMQKYKWVALLALAVQQQCFDVLPFAEMIAKVSGVFNAEHQLDVSDFKKLNAQYQLYRTAEIIPLAPAQQQAYEAFITSFIAVLNGAETAGRLQLFTDLFHMHVNRLFPEMQRTHEMVCYYFISKDMQRFKAINKR